MKDETIKTTNNLSNVKRMPQRVYKHRILGMALGSLPIAVIFFENSAPLYKWIWWFLSCYIWPHFAYIRASHSKNPYKQEKNNLAMDSFIAGSWASLMNFNILPATLLLIITLSDKISSGIRNMWLYSLPFMLLGIIIGGIITGFTFVPQSSTAVIIACIPIMTIHTLLVSIASSRLIRRVQKQNAQLAKLSQNDTLTSLFNRRYWQQQVEKLMDKCQNTHQIATLIIIDIDYFKKINDSFGHSVGDDIIKDVANIIKKASPQNAIIGRLGGDEFAMVVPLNKNQTNEIAKIIAKQLNKYQQVANPKLKLTLSMGIAEIDKDNCEYRRWFDTADKALYQAKNTGRDKIIVAGYI